MGGAHEVVELLVSWAVTTAVVFVVVIGDERRLDPERLARAWPPSSRDAAVVAFGIFALPFHFARTRGHLRSARGALGLLYGFGVGLAWVVFVGVVNAVVMTALAWLAG